jgi:hypothetical protein
MKHVIPYTIKRTLLEERNAARNRFRKMVNMLHVAVGFAAFLWESLNFKA